MMMGMGTGIRNQGTGNRSQGTGNRSQGSRNRDREARGRWTRGQKATAEGPGEVGDGGNGGTEKDCGKKWKRVEENGKFLPIFVASVKVY